MRIAMMAPLWKIVPPKQYGGSELVVSDLTEALVEQGHEVTLFACGGSKTRAHLEKVIAEPMYDLLGGKFDFKVIQPYEFLSYHATFVGAKSGQYDVIHNHMGFHVAAIAAASPVPMVTTNHSSTSPDFPYLAEAASEANYVSISNAQRSLAPDLNYVATVYHGLNLSSIKFRAEPDEYLLFLATMWKEKGVDRAIEIAKRSGKRLIMAGDIRRQSDFDEIKPLIDGEQVVYLGEVGAEVKAKLMRNALAYLFPIRWNEAFGLTVVESLAAGTPVIAYPNGSLPELIESGKNGYLVENIEEAVEAVKVISKISRQYCSQAAREKFDRSVMAKNYVKVYEGLR